MKKRSTKAVVDGEPARAAEVDALPAVTPPCVCALRSSFNSFTSAAASVTRAVSAVTSVTSFTISARPAA